VHGWTLEAYLYTPRSCPQKDDWNEFVDRYSGINFTKITWKKIVWSLQNYIYTLIVQYYVNIKNGCQ
jgi:hypothetical protein